MFWLIDFYAGLWAVIRQSVLKTKIAAETTSSPDESPWFSGAVEQPVV
jgi:hypothetical protein